MIAIARRVISVTAKVREGKMILLLLSLLLEMLLLLMSLQQQMRFL